MFSLVTSLFRRTRVRGIAAVMLALVAMLGVAAPVLAQTNPTAQSLPYTQNFASLDSATVTTLPVGWASWTLSESGPSSPTPGAYRITAAVLDRPVAASGTAASDAGDPYNYLGQLGYLNSDTFDGAIALAVNTTGKKNIVVAYDIMTIRNPFDGAANTRISAATLQYRVGTTGDFTNVPGVTYGTNSTLQTTAVTTPQNLEAKSVTLPADADNAAVVQLRWVSRDSSGAGSRPSIALDHVAVSGTDFFTITASAGANGGISPPGAVQVNSGADQSFTITPDAGFIVADVLVDGASVGAVTSHTFTAVSANHTLSASFVADPISVVSASAPGTYVTTVNPSVPVAVSLARSVTTPMLGFSVTFTLAGLTTTPGAITEGGFLAASGSTTNFHVTDNGGGSYTVDGVTLGIPCGSSATSGTLFTVGAGSSSLSGPGSLTITSLELRDCSNGPLASSIGTAASVSVDRSTPVVAVTSPNGGESWLVGSLHAITWTASDAEGIAANSIVLEYSADGGSNWLPVASGLANTGTFDWTVPNTPSLTTLVRASATDLHANVATDASDAAFTIQGSTTTSLTSAPNPSLTGQSATLTATVSPAAADGSVEFFDGIVSLGLGTLSGGTASLATSTLGTGAHSLTAVYAGSTLYTGSASAAHAHTVNPGSTTTTVTSTPNPSVFGQSTVVTATVAVDPPGSGTASGSVEFFSDAVSLGLGTLSGGTASISTATLAVGPHSLTAVYAGEVSFTGSTSVASTHTVNPAATATSLTSSPNPTQFGQSATLTASVAAVAPGAGGPEGSVEFFEGLTSLGTSPVSSGTAALVTSTLSVGSHALTAVYSGAVSFSASTSAIHTHDVTAAASSVALTSSPNPSVVGEVVALSATVTPATASGTVEFFAGATSLGTGTVSGGTATFNTSALTLGAHSLTAVYSGDASYSGSTSPNHSHTVNAAATATTLTNTPNPSLAGQSVALTATVAVLVPGAGTATGNVEFFAGVTSLGTAALSGGSAVLNTSSLAVGTHSLTASYLGSSDFTGSTSAASSQTVNPASSTTTVASASNPTVFGQSTTITATVAVNAPGSGTATGSVEFFSDAVSLGLGTLAGGTASIGTATLTVGPHSITAVYAGDASFTGSTSATHDHVVDLATTSTTIASDLNPSAFGQLVTFTSTVAVNAPGAGSPSGTVTFFDGVTLLGSSPLSGLTATFNTSALAAGTHSITAAFSGDGSFSGSTSAALSQVVNAAATSVTLTAAPNPGVSLDPETLTATVSPSAATGTVEFFDGVTSLGTSPVSGGVATFITSSLSVAVHSLTAAYSGDLDHAPSTSSAVSLEIQAKIVATAGPNGSITPSGTVLVSLGATPAFAFAADASYHVLSVTVDGAPAALTSPYTFAAVSSNHTIDVQFEVNPAVAAISTLASAQVRTGNDGDGTTQITLTWSPVAAGSTVEVWRKGYGNYPEYDDGPAPGGTPVIPAAYPPADWTLTTVTASGTSDEPSSRDFWYYVAYVRDEFGTVSPVSNRTGGTLNYHLGDVTDGVTPGQGDNRVSTADVSEIGAHYGITGPVVDAVSYLDVGPTTSTSVHGRPMTDNKVNFEDLVMFAINYFPVTSAPRAQARPAGAAADVLTLQAPEHAVPGENIDVRLDFQFTGRIQALSATLSWDPAVVQPVSYTAGDAILAQDGIVLSAEPGMVDGASFAGNGLGLVGEGEFATVRFRVVGAGDPKFGFARVDGRDSQNHSAPVHSGVLAVPRRVFVTAFAPATPNPFGRATTFAFSLAKAGHAELEVFSVDGRRVRTVVSGMQEAGEHRLEWNGTDDSGRALAAGVYYARLVTAQGRFTRVVTYLR